jgi:hypothetical protein
MGRAANTPGLKLPLFSLLPKFSPRFAIRANEKRALSFFLAVNQRPERDAARR